MMLARKHIGNIVHYCVPGAFLLTVAGLTKTAKTGASSSILQLVVNLPKVALWREIWLTRLEIDRAFSRALSDYLRVSCQDLSADSHCGRCLISSYFSFTAKHRTARIHILQALSCTSICLHLAQLKHSRFLLQFHCTLSIEIFVGSVLGKLRIRGMSAVSLSHQWPQKRDSSNRVLYVPGAWCNILIKFSAPPEVHKSYSQ